MRSRSTSAAIPTGLRTSSKPASSSRSRPSPPNLGGGEFSMTMPGENWVTVDTPAQVFKERPCATRKRLVRPPSAATPYEARHHETEHLLDRIAGLVGDLSAGAVGATTLPAPADPNLDKPLSLGRELLPCPPPPRPGKNSQTPPERGPAPIEAFGEA